MAIAKSDTYTQTQKQFVFYSDFPNSFAVSPVGDELGRLINERSVIQAMKNLIFTILGERPYQPDIGSTLYNSDFEMNDNLTDLSVAQSILNSLQKHEKRANIISVSADSNPDNYEIDVTVTFTIINSSTPKSFSVVLKRIR